MSGDSDKTEEPTDHKLQESRKKGQVCKSQEVTQALLLVATATVLFKFGNKMVNQMADFMKFAYALIPENNILTSNTFPGLTFIIITFFSILLPLLAVGFVTALVGNIMQVKGLFTTEPLNPKLSKINPIQGFKKIFSMRSALEFFKQIAKLAIVGIITYKIVKFNIGKLGASVLWDVNVGGMPTMLSFLKAICTKIISNVAGAMIIIAGIDYILQKKLFLKDMRMSMKELKDEYKETEGNPQVKGKMRQLMRQAAQGRMMQEVPDASAVVANPTHIAVAIKYKQGETPAPIVVAKGERLMAVQIKTIAEDNEIPIIENVELARTLFKACKVGQSIPAELYKAVAEVLAFIIKIKQKKQMRTNRVKRLKNLQDQRKLGRR